MMRQKVSGRKYRWGGSLLFASVLLMLCVLTGCGSTKTNAPDLQTLQTDMLAADSSLPKMVTVSSDSEDAETLFSYLSDEDYGDVEGFFLSYSYDGLADEIAVVRMKKSNDVDAMKASLESHVDGRVSLFRSYDPSQVSRAENAEIFTSGNDVVLIISDNASQVEKAYTADWKAAE